MKYIKTFESFSPINEEEGIFKNMMRGSKSIKIDDNTLKSLKAKYCIVKEDGKETKPTKKAIFTLEDGKIKGLPNAMLIFNNLKKNFQMNDNEALTVTMGIYDWNGFITVDQKESKFDKEKEEFTVVKAASNRGSGFNN